MSLRIIHISDTHGHPIGDKLKNLSGDLLIHSGDLSRVGKLQDTSVSLNDLASFQSNFDKIILVPGNHDWFFERDKALAKQMCNDLGIILLNDSGCEYKGIKIWGSPISPFFLNWAFNRFRGSEIQRHWEIIPDDTQLLITHGPVHGILDLTTDRVNAGCEMLVERIAALSSLKLHLCGHIHEAHGIKKVGNITYSNASLMDVKYQFTQQPNIIEWDSL